MNRCHLRRSCLLLLTATWAGILASCDPVGPQVLDAEFRATWAGQPWHGAAGASVDGDTIRISGTAVSRTGPGEKTNIPTLLLVRAPGVEEGSYVLEPGAAQLLYLLGGDVVTAVYASSSDPGNHLVIEQVTATTVRGTIAFEALSDQEHAPEGVRARFEGQFEAPLQP